jgi:hypothetical protein
MSFDAALASKFASLALAHVRREYPNKLDHVMNGPQDVRSPRDLHPIFYGSFDWHSNVHGYWLLATLRRLAPTLGGANRIEALFAEQFTPEKVQAELAYLSAPNRGGFERPYGWAWALMLGAELRRQGSDALDPLVDAFTGRLRAYLEKLTYPIRVGTHFNTAFAMALSLDYADVYGDDATRRVIQAKARDYFGNDRACQAWEPGGDDFLSSALIEAECMRRVLPRDEWVAWFGAFLPDLERCEPATLFTPAFVSDRTDGKIAHLDGLNLSRAWCWRSIAGALPRGDARVPLALDAADRHLEASLPHVAGDYAGEHWLATFALLALTNTSEPR